MELTQEQEYAELVQHYTKGKWSLCFGKNVSLRMNHEDGTFEYIEFASTYDALKMAVLMREA